MENDSFEDFRDDPELGDENDPEYKEEMFQTYKAMEWKPEDLKHPEDQGEYADWLQRQT